MSKSDTEERNVISVHKFLHNYEAKEPKGREVTRDTTNAYGGDLEHMMQGACSGCLKRCNRDFTQSIYCQNSVSTLMSSSLQGSVLIMHGPVGCGSQNHGLHGRVGLASKHRGVPKEEVIWLSSNMTEDSVIRGGVSNLREAILKAEKEYHPSSIFVLNSCAPGVIGDDIESVIDDLRDQVNAILVPLHCPGFAAKVFTSAYDVVYHGVLKNFEFDQGMSLAKTDKKEKIVNLFVASSISAYDEKEIIDLLGKIGIQARTFIEYRSPEELKRITEADLNVCLCHVHDIYFVNFLKEKYGMPYITPSIPIGISATNQFITEIAEFFGLEEEAKELTEKETQKVQKAVAPIKARIQGKTAVISGGYLRIGTTALLLDDIGIKVLGLRHFNYDEFGNPLFEEVKERIGNITNSVSTQASELVNLLRKLKPDFAITHPGAGVWVEKTGVPTLVLFSENFSYFGYRGVFELARRIDRKIRNYSFTTHLSENVELPFLEQWYEKDPYYYIND
ncbi:nitrogenase component 1 [[Clostridium] polysaccharolyticum]|uniref:Nitrogenase molybdenum-iron protein alpha chain n=1 Tax=[Clostridium] polysaccharolyticum TaxID=29364 RepID=A0A1I0BXV4_9FIRM|nr:nitrogenase component 1 [[Clostridium] polysaccharolyticum]SET11218.1 nitrogenase molybdenum-iron protein alpha chain [[Clostridium] polysaccharolyticum]